jgi:hypothetical protein
MINSLLKEIFLLHINSDNIFKLIHLFTVLTEEDKTPRLKEGEEEEAEGAADAD